MGVRTGTGGRFDGGEKAEEAGASGSSEVEEKVGEADGTHGKRRWWFIDMTNGTSGSGQGTLFSFLRQRSRNGGEVFVYFDYFVVSAVSQTPGKGTTK